MNIFLIIPILILIFYVHRIGRWLHAWRTTPEFTPSEISYSPVSIVVPFRNEAGNIENLLSDLIAQDYPPGMTEIILVDDNSDDDSVAGIRNKTAGFENFRCISNTAQPGKKGALNTGILAASHDLIVTTDADARMSDNWLALVSSFNVEKNPSLIIGLVYAEQGSDIANQFIADEFLSLVASGAGAASTGNPIFCNGANLAFRKSVYMRLTDAMKESTVSGDDTFLLHAMKKASEKIAVLKSANALVSVKAPENLRQFMNQHIRWASKSRKYSDRDTIIVAMIVLLTNLSLIITMGLSLALFVFLFAVKAFTDYQFLKDFGLYFGIKINLIYFVLFSLVYPFYILITAIAGLFVGYSWKGRRYGY